MENDWLRFGGIDSPGAREDQDADSGDQRNDVKQFVDEVDEEVPDEHLETRVDETVDNRAEPSSD
jgi:hypothetical protein